MRPTYAVIFKTHFWDPFVARQLARLRATMQHGTLFIAVDETFGPVAIADEAPVVRVTMDKIDALGLAKVTTHGSVLWYNIDYPHYVALREVEPFDYYVTIEYDAVCNLDLDRLISTIAEKQCDYVGHPVPEAIADWPWFATHKPIYGGAMRASLSCFAVFSRRALELLLKRRQDMSRDFAQKRLGFWPNNEAFIPNEIERAGYRIASLADFGSVSGYNWWPPKHEAELDGMGDAAFIHPVLTGDRYIRSLVYHEPSFGSFFRSDSVLRRKLAIYARGRQGSVLYAEVRRRVFAALTRRLEAWGLSPPWYANAEAGAAQVAQTRSVHN